ncbi:MAG: Type 1 glutamine amidotransferase-like domain-containing protein [Candidatus Nanohalobium sp.]
MGSIIAIGGGSIDSGETLPIDREIVEEAGKDNPKALFLPTASEDSSGYIEAFHKTYEDRLGCEVDVLELTKKNYTEEKIREKINEADFVYVGGGNTKGMIEIWREKKVDKYLKQAYENGSVMSGLSAGAICWFEYGHSDSESYEKENNSGWNFIQVEGLNIVENVLFCPHYHQENREASFEEMLRDNPGLTGLAIDNNAAVKVEGDKLEILKSRDEGTAYIAEVVDGEFKLRELAEGEKYPLEKL